MSVYRDMAMDAGYSGEEADQMAQMLEREAYDDYQRHLGELAAIDARNQAIGEAINLLVSEGLGQKVWWCERHRATNTYKTSSHFCTIAVYQEAFEAVVFDCEMVERLLIPLPEQEVVK